MSRKVDTLALGLPSHRAFATRESALEWLAVQALNAKGRSAAQSKISSEVKHVPRRSAWVFDATPRTAAAVSGARTAGAGGANQHQRLWPTNPLQWPDATNGGGSSSLDVYNDAAAWPGRGRYRRDAWAADISRDSCNRDLR